MKSVIKWVIFVPVCILSVMLMIFTSLNANGTFLGLSANTAAETVIFAVLGIFLLFFIISLFDRTTAPVHLLKKNPFCAVTALLAAFMLAASSALDFTNMARFADFDPMLILTAVFSMLTALALLFVALNHFTGTNTPKTISLLYLVLPLWCGVHLISRFLANTAVPVAPAETMDLIFFVTMALFGIYAMMIHAVIPGRNAVKSAITMGFPTAISAFVYSATELIELINNGSDWVFLIPALSYAMLGLYVLGFTAELSFTSKTKEEVVILGSEEPETLEEYAEEPREEIEDSVDGELEVSEAKEAQVSVLEDSAFSTDASEDEVKVTAAVASRVIENDGEVDADELFAVAKASDTKIKKPSQDLDTRSENEMIIEGENEALSPQKTPLEPAPKGKTTREAVMFDDDFIISLDNLGSTPVASDAKINEAKTEEKAEAQEVVQKEEIPPIDESKSDEETESFSARMDEIDKLILSIQGEDSEDVKEPSENN